MDFKLHWRHSILLFYFFLSEVIEYSILFDAEIFLIIFLLSAISICCIIT